MTKILMEIQAQRSGETDEQTYERAMRDPEVQQIMGDPVMRRESCLLSKYSRLFCGDENGFTDCFVLSIDIVQRSSRMLSRIQRPFRTT